MKRFRILAFLLLTGILAGCGSARPNEIAPGQFTNQEFIYVQALTEDALVFTLGKGNYEAALYCYTGGNWENAGSMGLINGGGNMLFATHMHPENSRRLPDTWTCNADGGTLTGYMQWEATANATVKLYSHLPNSIQMEPGIEYAVAMCAFTDDEDPGSFGIDIGNAFNIATADLNGYTYAWVFTVKAL